MSAVIWEEVNGLAIAKFALRCRYLTRFATVLAPLSDEHQIQTRTEAVFHKQYTSKPEVRNRA
jgi:hypothetical protein